MNFGPQVAYTMDPFADSLNPLHSIHSHYSTFAMERQLPSEEDWAKLYQIFTRTAQLSLQSSEEAPNDSNDETIRTQRELEDIETILADALQGMDILNPERASELRRETQEGSSTQPAASPSAPTNLGSSSVHRQVIDPQGNILVSPQQNQTSGPVLRCSTCQTTTTPEWRRGPSGPRTLCNACGLAWAKMIRSRARGEEDDDDETGTENAQDEASNSTSVTTGDEDEEGP